MRSIPLEARRAMLIHAAAFAAMLPLVQVLHTTPVHFVAQLTVLCCFQAHSFIALGIIIGVVFLLEFHRWMIDARLFGAWIAAGKPAFSCDPLFCKTYIYDILILCRHCCRCHWRTTDVALRSSSSQRGQGV
jgi:hypothetical protein